MPTFNGVVDLCRALSELGDASHGEGSNMIPTDGL